MPEPIYHDSNYRFTDPVRVFKANDPYFFEVDNIPLKQLQENCLWLKDQLTKEAQSLLNVKRADIDELRPYVTGEDRIVRVKPGRFTARINDASTKEPLEYLKQLGGIGGDQGYPGWHHDNPDSWQVATASQGNFPPGTVPSWNDILYTALEKFKSSLAQNAVGMTGLEESVFTRPTISDDYPVNTTGITWNADGGAINYPTQSIPGVNLVPAIVTQALLWAKSVDGLQDNWIATTFDNLNSAAGFARMPITENQFIKLWRGVARNAIVDVDDEITVEVPIFQPTDFDYIDENGINVAVEGVQSRIDMIFIYSKPVDASAARYMKGSAIQSLTKPALGLVRGAGLKMQYQAIAGEITQEYGDVDRVDSQGNMQILAAAGDVNDTTMGFTSTSANELFYDVRGSFPAPDDLLNIAPLLSEQLESNALELVGQSILPVAYIWVQGDSSLVARTDLIDIRPFFRTAELTYNERAGLAAAVPQVSLANPVASIGEIDRREINLFHHWTQDINDLAETLNRTGVVAMGYVYGGWNFGPEGALYDHAYKVTHDGNSENLPPNAGQPGGGPTAGDQSARAWLTARFNLGAGNIEHVPEMPDWDLSTWVQLQQPSTGGPVFLQNQGLYANDYLTNFMSTRKGSNPQDIPTSGTAGNFDPAIVAGSFTRLAGSPGWGHQRRWSNAQNEDVGGTTVIYSNVFFTYVKKKILFNKPPWLLDYDVEVNLVNCLGQNNNGYKDPMQTQNWGKAATYYGAWVEKGTDDFTIYYAINAAEVNAFPPYSPQPLGGFHLLAPHVGSDNIIHNRREFGNAWAGFIVPVEPILDSNPNIMGGTGAGPLGYVGNPRVGKCTLPTVMWKMTAISTVDSAFLYTNLGGTNPQIELNNIV